jgi:tRNA nucleotidyltransferase (CCA-adding enzyme)
VDFHPEGDAFEHTMLIVDKVAASPTGLAARFAGLTHDLGKGTTAKEMLPHHYGHEKRGLDVLEIWNRRMTLPKKWMQAGLFIIHQHMRAARLNKPGKIAELLLKAAASPLKIADFQAVIRADHHGLPAYLAEAPAIIAAMQKVNGGQAPKNLQGAQIGDWVRSQQVKVVQNFKYHQGESTL